MELSASRVRLYRGPGVLAVNLPHEQERAVEKLQTSINEVKKRVQLTDSKRDIEPLGFALVVLLWDMKAARPAMEKSCRKAFYCGH